MNSQDFESPRYGAVLNKNMGYLDFLLSSKIKSGHFIVLHFIVLHCLIWPIRHLYGK